VLRLRDVMNEIVVVGGSLAGLRAVESLRSRGFAGTVTVVGAEPHRPYDRPPLSKRLLSGDWDPERIALRKADDMDSLDVTWRLGVPAAGLDLERRVVRLADDSEVAFDGLVVATGSTPRKLPGQDAFDHVVQLRTLDDALDLRRRIAAGDARVVVVGAGFIGLEVAATARGLGNEVVVLEGAPAPLMRAIGAEMGAAVAAVHADHGVEIRCDVMIEGFADDGLALAGGRHEPADVVVVGIGVAPETSWLEGSGLSLGDGVRCAPDLNAGVPLVYAAGDLVRWHHPLFDEEMRIEHWTNAAEQGALAASNLLAEAAGEPTEPYAPVPFFWSEQYDRRIQFLGRAAPDDEIRLISGSVDERRFAVLFGRDGRLRGALGVDMPRHVMRFRNHLLEQIGWDDALALAAEL
jgi:NADPH-dependent 2,4-dienoyl-CoA reductase/sulfur reductase-like enzyme